MFNWAKQQLANVAGTQEPIYGPSAIKSVAAEAETTPFTELSKDDFKWAAMDTTCVETQSFYLMSDSGIFGLAQVIYSNVAGIRTTCQFNAKVFSNDASKPHLWSSTPLSNIDFSEDKYNFYADNCAVELSEDGSTYTIKSMADAEAMVNLSVTKLAPAFHAGETGNTLYGTDLTKPWGSMRHAFWPRCSCSGTVVTPDGTVDFAGKAFLSHALQGMKPHHAAARWDFADFQGPTYSAILMSYTTPPSYGSTVVSVGGIARDGEIVVAGTDIEAHHTEVDQDDGNDWPEPKAIRMVWRGKTKDGKPVEGVLEGKYGPRLDRIDVMAEVPGFVKTIVASAAGTRPYIYQFSPKSPRMSLKLKIGDEEIVEEGDLFAEATFISE